MNTPANTKRLKNVVITSLQRRDVAETLLRRCVLAGTGLSIFKINKNCIEWWDKS